MTHKVTNNAGRRIGVPIRQAFILNAGESRNVTDGELAQMENNRTISRWMETGILSIASSLGEAPVDGREIKQPAPKPERKPQREKAAPPPKEESREELPEGITGVGVEREVFGGGWQHLWVNGFRVTDKKVRTAEADAMAADYE